MSFKISKYLYKIFSLTAKFIICIFLTYSVIFSIAGTIGIIVLYKNIVKPFHEVQYLAKHNPAETVFMKNYRLEMKTKNKTATVFHIFVPNDSISRFLKSAVIAAEDDAFYTHPGFDLEAMLSAYDYNRVHNRNVRGASTITQQLAKNLFLTNEKNFSRKIKELGYTLLMEKYLGKDRILELYLNYAQWGDSVFGCEAASRYYFKKSCTHLSITESARLAASLVSPERLNPLNVKSGFLQRRIEVIANNLFLKHIIDDSAYTLLSGKKPQRDDSTSDYVNNDGIPVPKPVETSKFIAETPKAAVVVKRGHKF